MSHSNGEYVSFKVGMGDSCVWNGDVCVSRVVFCVCVGVVVDVWCLFVVADVDGANCGIIAVVAVAVGDRGVVVIGVLGPSLMMHSNSCWSIRS